MSDREYRRPGALEMGEMMRETYRWLLDDGDSPGWVETRA